MRGQRRVGPVERDHHGVGTFGLEALDLLRHGLAARRHVHPALERRDDVVGSHLLAVVEFDAFAQRDRVDEAVLRNRRHALRQHRCHVPVGVEGVQRLVDVLHDRADQVGSRRHGVERLRLADHRQIGGAALRRRGERRAGRKHYRCRCGQRDDREPGADSRVGVTGMRAADAGAKHDFSSLTKWQTSVARCGDGALSNAGRVIKLHRGGESTLFWNGVKGRQKSRYAIGEP